MEKPLKHADNPSGCASSSQGFRIHMLNNKDYTCVFVHPIRGCKRALSASPVHQLWQRCASAATRPTIKGPPSLSHSSVTRVLTMNAGYRVNGQGIGTGGHGVLSDAQHAVVVVSSVRKAAAWGPRESLRHQLQGTCQGDSTSHPTSPAPP